MANIASSKRTEKYQKLTHHEHVLALPDTYIGSVKEDLMHMWLISNGQMIYKEISYVPGLYKIYDEILVNAHDHTVRDSSCKTIKVDINRESGQISVWNDGNGIDVEINKKERIYNPELIFGNLLTSSNYNQVAKKWGGKNGYGAKLTNIYSKHFYIETVDALNQLKYYQHFFDNMYKKDEPEISHTTNSVKPYTKITFNPDYERFGVDGLSDDMIGLFKKRVYDIAFCGCRKVKVYLNNELITMNSFQDYIKLYFPEVGTRMTYCDVNEYWKIGVVYTPNSGFSHISHVNGIWTYSQTGGTHVAHVTDQIVKGLQEYIKKNYKDLNVKPSYLKDNMTIFVNCITNDPDFSSQTKECLTTKVSSFIQKCELEPHFIESIAKLGIVDDAIEFAKLKNLAELKKTDGKKIQHMHHLDKLKDAKWAGTRRSNECRLIITEGDSAASFAIEGLEVIGRERYGVFPIRGKMLNVRDAPTQKILHNTEITKLKQILGLRQNVKYTKHNINKLRYGGILILTDADSVTGDTPLLLMYNGVYEIRTIDSLSDNWLNINGKEYGLTNYYVWTDKGWTQIQYVMRHRVSKRIYRVITSSGIVDVTEDHSLLNEYGEKIKPTECHIGQKLLHNFPNFSEEYINTISHVSMNSILSGDKAYSMGINCDNRITDSIINSSKRIQKRFLQGYCHNNGIDMLKPMYFPIKDKFSTQILYLLCKGLDYEVSIVYNSEFGEYCLFVTNKHAFDSNDDNNNKIIEIVDLGITDAYVYDLETENHHFQAGIGSMIVHNTDGSHIKGLVINFIHYFWPELLQIDNFFQTIATPIIKATMKSNKSKQHVFYTLSEYNKWANDVNVKLHLWTIKYYKGLGTSKNDEARMAFADFDKKILSYVWERSDTLPVNNDIVENSSDSETKNMMEEDENEEISEISYSEQNDLTPKHYSSVDINSKSHAALTLAFTKTFSDKRKLWLREYDKNVILEPVNQQIPYSEFINKDLIHFSNYDNIRSIPSMCDGLKPSQRKILFTMLDKRYDSSDREQKVQGLGSEVQKRTSYIHGEQSLFDAIIKMAQNFTGSNNINLLFPDGNFGSRRQGGDDAASPRYIHTYLEPITRYIFRKEDEPIYTYLIEENIVIEPEVLAPIIPMILVNGAQGIGTGYSTNIPSYNPKDIITNLLLLLHDEETFHMTPWYRDFQGCINRTENFTYTTHGKYEVEGENKIVLSDLPIGTWTDDYENFLKSLLINYKCDNAKQIIDTFDNSSGNNTINFIITLNSCDLRNLIKNNTLEKKLKLYSHLSESNMYLYNEKGKITKYDIVDDILREFFIFRRRMYKKRMNYHIHLLENELAILNYKIKFIKAVCAHQIIIERKRKSDIIEQLMNLAFPKLSHDINAIDDVNSDAGTEIVTGTIKKSYKTYDYITNLPLFSLTKEKIEELDKQYSEKSDELSMYKRITWRQLWESELYELLCEYDKWVNSNTLANIPKSKSSDTRRKPRINKTGEN